MCRLSSAPGLAAHDPRPQSIQQSHAIAVQGHSQRGVVNAQRWSSGTASKQTISNLILKSPGEKTMLTLISGRSQQTKKTVLAQSKDNVFLVKLAFFRTGEAGGPRLEGLPLTGQRLENVQDSEERLHTIAFFASERPQPG